MSSSLKSHDHDDENKKKYIHIDVHAKCNCDHHDHQGKSWHDHKHDGGHHHHDCDCKDNCNCKPQWKKGDEYVAGFRNDEIRGFAFDTLAEFINFTETPVMTIANLPINCVESKVWINVTLGVSNNNFSETQVRYRIYRNSVDPANLIYQARDCYGGFAFGTGDTCDLTHLQAIDPQPGSVGEDVSYIVTAQLIFGSAFITGPKTATAVRIGECC